MYCINCGKMISNNARFCNFCGVRTALNIPEYSSPLKGENADLSAFMPKAPATQSVPEPVQTPKQSTADFDPVLPETSGLPEGPVPSESSVLPETPVLSEAPVLSETPGLSETSGLSESSGLSETPSLSESSIPEYSKSPLPSDFTPNSIPTEGVSTAENAEFSGFGAPVPMDNAKIAAPAKEPPERKYTLGHIMMCLAAVAVMAIVAGVFAGLYFSVV